ncbi:hypothetical protein D9757_014541 [Collybiopsis confluens]|uniref:Uncharacterized protein n=1 Tax=Collybiopsis confluens TaxID=2823264 RepID=A0A8H5CIB9_9AGAR|nr:hypothetical protein D9757_014541 [Collybiopsis confluens]
MLKSLAIFSLVLLMSLVHGHPSLFPNGTFNDDDALKFFFKRGDPDVLPSHYWRRAKHQEDIDAFQARYNLTLVSAQPQDAALLPSWPQALLQYLLINPIINLSCSSSTTRTYNGQVMYHEHTEQH